MALQLIGQISLSNITAEMGLINSNVSLGGLSTHSTLNDESPYKPNESQPHGMSEFYAYDHNYSSFKALTGGPQNPSFGGKWFDFCEDRIEFFYAHNGNKDLPMIGDIIYSNNKGNYTKVGAVHIKLQDPNTSEELMITTDANGAVLRINSCEGVEQPEEPGRGDPGLNDPFIGR